MTTPLPSYDPQPADHQQELVPLQRSLPLPEPSRHIAPWAALMPRSWEEAERFAGLLAASTLVPQSFRGKPGDIMIAILWGAEINLRPLQSLNSIAVVNGRPAIYGDAMIALMWSSGKCLSYNDWIEGEGLERVGVSRSHRTGTPEPIERRFSVADAKLAGLWGKIGPWQSYPNRMLVMRARGFLLRDLYPDVLRGLITVEEAQDIFTPSN